jgi:molybdopterin-binding protein
MAGREDMMSMRKLVGLSARNQLRGTVEDVRIEGLLAEVRLQVGDQLLTAVITRDSALELGLERGESAVAVIKSTEVMIAKEEAR